MKTKLLVLLLLITHVAYAALPPLYQSIHEINEIVNSPQLGELLPSGEMILSVEKTQEGYTVFTNKYFLNIEFIPIKNQKPGPQKFTLIFHTPILKKL